MHICMDVYDVCFEKRRLCVCVCVCACMCGGVFKGEGSVCMSYVSVCVRVCMRLCL